MTVATQVKKWTLEELHRLPDDGNKYELVRGELFVTPPPGDEHETIAAKLNAVLAPYVGEHGLGLVYRPKAVMRYEGSEVEPDLMVRQPHPDRKGNDSDWDSAPSRETGLRADRARPADVVAAWREFAVNVRRRCGILRGT